MLPEKIIETSLDCVDQTGQRSRLVVELGRPYRALEGEWACPVAIHGLHDRLQDVRGEDSLQALCLAVSLIRSLLSSYLEDGGLLMHPDTDYPYDLNATFGRVGFRDNSD